MPQPQQNLSPGDALQLRLIAGRFVHNEEFTLEAATAAIAGRCRNPAAVLDALPDMVLEMDRALQIQFCNDNGAPVM